MYLYSTAQPSVPKSPCEVTAFGGIRLPPEFLAVDETTVPVFENGGTATARTQATGELYGGIDPDAIVTAEGLATASITSVDGNFAGFDIRSSMIAGVDHLEGDTDPRPCWGYSQSIARIHVAFTVSRAGMLRVDLAIRDREDAGIAIYGPRSFDVLPGTTNVYLPPGDYAAVYDTTVFADSLVFEPEKIDRGPFESFLDVHATFAVDCDRTVYLRCPGSAGGRSRQLLPEHTPQVAPLIDREA